MLSLRFLQAAGKIRTATLPYQNLPSAMQRKTRLLLVDGMSLAWRSFHGMKHLHNAKNLGAIFGYSRMLLQALLNSKPTHAAVCLDSPGKTFRHELYPSYKAHRPPVPDGLGAQLHQLPEINAAFSVPTFALSGYEGDDLIATLARARRFGIDEVVIFSQDKDFLQLLDSNLHLVQPVNGGGAVIFTEPCVVEKYGLEPGQFRDFLALTGDAADGIPGVKGVGEKTAIKLLKHHRTIFQLLQDCKSGKEVHCSAHIRKQLLAQEELLWQCQRLVSVEEHIPIEQLFPQCTSQRGEGEEGGEQREDWESALDTLSFHGIDFEKSLRFLEKKRFYSISTLLRKSMEQPGTAHMFTGHLPSSDNAECMLAADDWKSAFITKTQATRDRQLKAAASEERANKKKKKQEMAAVGITEQARNEPPPVAPRYSGNSAQDQPYRGDEIICF